MNKPVHKQVCDLIESYKEINFFYNETDRWQMILLIAQKFSGIFHDIHYFFRLHDIFPAFFKAAAKLLRFPSDSSSCRALSKIILKHFDRLLQPIRPLVLSQSKTVLSLDMLKIFLKRMRKSQTCNVYEKRCPSRLFSCKLLRIA